MSKGTMWRTLLLYKRNIFYKSKIKNLIMSTLTLASNSQSCNFIIPYSFISEISNFSSSACDQDRAQSVSHHGLSGVFRRQAGKEKGRERFARGVWVTKIDFAWSSFQIIWGLLCKTSANFQETYIPRTLWWLENGRRNSRSVFSRNVIKLCI